MIRYHYSYDKVFDHTIWRLTDVGRIGIHGTAAEVPRKRLRLKELSMLDTFAGLGTVALAAQRSGMEVNNI
jgi:hypothetical protein